MFKRCVDAVVAAGEEDGWEFHSKQQSVDIYRKTITLSGVTGIINFKEAGIKVFPIPAKEQLTFVTNGQQITKVEISTMTGYVFKKYTSVSTLDLSDIPAGMYIIELTTKYHIVRDKLLIE